MSSQNNSITCVVLGCSSSHANVNSSKTFHKFPTSEGLRSMWDTALSGHKWVPVWIQEHRWRVCSDHFSASDFLPSGDLRPRAVPSLLKRLSTTGSWFKDVKPKSYQSVKLKPAMAPRNGNPTGQSFSDDVKTPPKNGCCVVACGRRLRPKMLFEIPKSESLRNMWLLALEGHVKRADLERVSTLRVCLSHFPAEDILLDGEPHPLAVPSLLNRSLTGKWIKPHEANSEHAIPAEMNGSMIEGSYSSHPMSIISSYGPDLSPLKQNDEEGSICTGDFNPLEFVEVKIESDSNSDSSKVPISCQPLDPLSEPSDLKIVEDFEEAPKTGWAEELPPKLPRPLPYMSCSEVRSALCKVTCWFNLLQIRVMRFGTPNFLSRRFSGATTDTNCRNTGTGPRCRRGGRTS